MRPLLYPSLAAGMMLLLLAQPADGVIRGGLIRWPKGNIDDANWHDIGVYVYDVQGTVAVDVTFTDPAKPVPVAEWANVGENEPAPPTGRHGIGFMTYPAKAQSKPAITEEALQKHCAAVGKADMLGNEIVLKKKEGTFTGYEGEFVFNEAPEAFVILILFRCSNEESQSSDEVPVADWFKSFTVIVTEKNPGSYLQSGDQQLPWLFLCFFCVAAGMLLQWIKWMNDNREHVNKVHFLMAITLFMKSGTLFFEATRYFYFSDHGQDTGFYRVMYFIFLFLKGMLLFTVVILIATGWSFLKPCLSDRDKKLLAVAVPLQVIVNIIRVVFDHMREDDAGWEFYQIVLIGLDLVSCFLVFIPMTASVRQLHEAATTDGKVARNLGRLKRYRVLYFVVVLYMYVKTVVCGLLLPDYVSYDQTWIPPFVDEVATLICYAFVGSRFRPHKENPYLELDEDYGEEMGVADALDKEMEDRQKDKDDLDRGNQPYSISGGTMSDIRGTAGDRKGAPPALINKKQVEADL